MHLLAILAVVAYALAAGTIEASEVPIPEFYGVYVVSDGKLYEIGAENELEKFPVHTARTESDFKSGIPEVSHVPLLPGDLNVLVFVKDSPLQIAAKMKLRKLPFVRRMVLNDDDPNYKVVYEPNASIATTEFGFNNLGITEIELRFKPVKDQDEMVLAVPSSTLPPGLFTLDGFLFGVAPIDAAATAQCIDATRPVGIAVRWRTWPCSDERVAAQPMGKSRPAARPSPDTSLGKEPEESAVGFVVISDDAPVFKKASGNEIKGYLSTGAAAANAKGSLLGLPTEFSLEELNGRTHVIYLEDGKTKAGWIESQQLQYFNYDCSCKPRCTPTESSLRQGTSWTDCFERARTSAAPSP